MGPARSDYRTGLLHALLAYACWGIMPLYFRIVNAAPMELVAHRILWSFLLLFLLLGARREMGQMLAVLRDRRKLAALTASTLLIAANWLIFIYAIENAHVVAVSIGYFLNPIVNVLLGVTLLGERLGRTQWLGILVVGCGVAILAGGALSMMAISATLAISFALYGLVRKMTAVGALAGLAVETAILVLPAFAMIAWAGGHGGLGFGRDGATTALLMASGVVTSVPLLLFASGARRLPLVTLGLVQYVAPTLQFLLGVFFFREHMDLTRWASIGLIWTGIAIFVAAVLHAARTQARSRPMPTMEPV